jgi:hypothetical protein
MSQNPRYRIVHEADAALAVEHCNDVYRNLDEVAIDPRGQARRYLVVSLGRHRSSGPALCAASLRVI